MSGRIIRAVDLFCGSGGTSTGLVQACQRLGYGIELTAVNHWPIAVETHAANHPWARHECARIDQLDPREVAPKGRIDVLVASPECTHFSRARGKAPKNDQSRASGWDVLRWVERLCPRDVILENVAEWQDWGPVNAATGQPIPGRAGETFAAFVTVLESLGYRVEWRILNSADFGGATTRRRLFMRARRGRHAPLWPAATHSETQGGILDLGKPWRPAREIIDWTFPSRSIFGRKTPLKPKTLKRIERGIEEFWGEYAQPFLVLLRGTSNVRSVDEPCPTLTAGGGHVALVDAEPFLLHATHGGRTHSISRPAPTITGANRGELGVVEPFLIEAAHGNDPRLGDRENNRRVHSLDRPVGAIPASNRFGVVEPFVVTPGGADLRNGRTIDRPLPTVTGSDRFGVVEPFLLSQASLGAPRPVSKPSPTICTDGAVSLVEPLLLSYYGHGGATPVGAPVPTVTTKDRFALLEGASLDIRFRMLQRHELAAAMGFPKGYVFAGNGGDQTKQIGNAVSVEVADALATAALTEVA